MIFIIEQNFANPTNQQQQSNSVDNALTTANATPARVYNLTAPNPVTNHTFTKTLGAWLHRPTFFTLPAFLLKLMFGEMSTLLIDGQKVLPRALLGAGFEFEHTALEQALEQQS